MQLLSTTSIFYLLMFFGLQQFVVAGPLGDFEEAATQPAKKSESVRVSRDGYYNLDDDEPGFFVELIGELMDVVIEEIFSKPETHRGPYDADPWSMPRPAMITTQDFSLGYQTMMLSDEIRGHDYSAEYKRNRFVLGVSSTQLDDANSDENLDINFYRFGITDPIADQWQWSATAGYVEMIGNEKHGGLGISTPIRWQAQTGISLEVEPTWYNINDQWTHTIDTRFRLPQENFGVQLGMRYWETQGESLYGPYLGVDLRW